MSSSRLLKLSVMASVALALSALLAGPALAGNEIAYDCKLDICLLDPANPAAVTNLTDNGETSIDEKPIWSPDGKKVAFISNFGVGGATKNLFVMEPEAPEQGFNIAVQATHFTSGVPIEEPVWSPDGTRLAFVYGNQESNDKVEVANSNGTTATPLVIAEHGVHPTWAPEGGKIAYSYEGHLYIEEAAGAGFPPPLTGAEGGEPVWSPDGLRIAFARKAGFASFDLGIVPAAGGSPTTLTSGLQFIYPSWSPSGSQVAYRGTGEQWRVVDADGVGDHPLPTLSSLSPDGPAPSWSPDGTRIVFQGYYYGAGPAKETNGVYVQSTDGSGAAIPLVQGEKYFTAPAWRPNPASAPQVFTPAGASAGASSPLPVTQPKPTTVWITKRIFVTKGPDYTVIIGSYGCGGPSCGVSTEGKAKGAAPAGLNFSLERTRLKAKARSKPSSVIVAKGRTTIPGGRSGPVKMKLTKAGAKLLEKQGSLQIAVTVTITIPGQKKIVEHRQVTVALRQSKKKHGGT